MLGMIPNLLLKKGVNFFGIIPMGEDTTIGHIFWDVARVTTELPILRELRNNWKLKPNPRAAKG